MIKPVAYLSRGCRMASFAASASAIAIAAPAIAQTAQQPDSSPTTAGTSTVGSAADASEVVIIGLRQSLANAQSIKRNADTVLDAITADDIGALPDRSVNEALQRVPGVAISRFASPSDSQHFSVQGSGVVIRGLSYVRGEFNGRDTFAPNGGREIGFSDVPSELVGSIEVYKNLTADMIEGGISGDVDINVRKPFDSTKDVAYLSGSVSYGDMRKRAVPSGVAVVSKQWVTGGGSRIGVLGSVVYSQIKSTTQSTYFSGWLPRQNDDANGNGVIDVDSSGNPTEYHVINAGTPYASKVSDLYPVPAGQHVYTPLGPGFRDQDIDRRRLGFAAGLQFESPDRKVLVTAQFLRTDSREENLDHTIEGANWYGDITSVYPFGNVEYDSNGLVKSGTLGRNSFVDGWYQAADGSYSYGHLPQFVQHGYELGLTNRRFTSRAMTEDQSLNVKWSPTDRLHFNFDGQYVNAKASNYDATVDGHTFSQINVDRTGDVPQITFVTPGFDTASYFANPNSIFLNNASVNRADNDGHEWAFRADAEYDLPDSGFFRRIRAGGRYADREQTVRTNDYNNWGSLSATWSYPTGAVSMAQAGNSYLRSFGDFFRGSAPTPPSAVYINDSIITNDAALSDYLRNVVKLGSVGSWVPLQDRNQPQYASRYPNCSTLIHEYFCSNEVYRNGEKTYSAYVRADFGADRLFGSSLNLSGNIGLRFVRTEDRAVGSINFPSPDSVFRPDSSGVDENGNPRGPRWTTIAEYCSYVSGHPNEFTSGVPLCTIPLQQALNAYAFANGAAVADNAKQHYNNWLPSLNLRLDITPKLVARFAASRAISRPNFGDLRDFVGIGVGGGSRDGSYGFSVNGPNPYLRPIKATQFDLTAEWYFAKVGQLTGAVFYKQLSNIILSNSPYVRTFTNNGQTFEVTGNGPANVPGKGDVYGGEVSYQQTFDFLPGALSGLGMQATYTYIKTSHIPNAPPANAPNDGNRPVLDVTGLYDNLPLAGMSKHNVNLSGFYDKHGFYARLAYSWRSRFLLSNRDCCFPFLPIYARSTGQLDGSLFYSVTPFLKVGIEAQNILDTTTRTSFLLNSSGLTAPRTYFKSDRQFTLSARATF